MRRRCFVSRLLSTDEEFVPFGFLSIPDAQFVVHHLLQRALIDDHRHRRDGDVANGTKLAAIVQMLVLQAKVIPDESTKDLDEPENEADHVGILCRTRAKLHEHVDNPNVAKNEILDDRCVVVESRRVDDLIAQEPILAGVLVEEAPVHFQVPHRLVGGANERGDDPNVQEWIRGGRAAIMLSRGSTCGIGGDDQEATGVFTGVDQVREFLFRVTVPT